MHQVAGSTASEGVIMSSNVIYFVALARKAKGTVYTDVTGALTVLSLAGHQYYIVAYNYDNNFIEAQEVSDLKDETIAETCKRYLANGGGWTQTTVKCD